MQPLGLQLLHALKTHGAREIFGIPGDFILPLFKQIEESGVLPLATLSHEPSLGFAADAAARMHTRAQFKAALDAAFAERGRFQLIELMVPPGDSMPTLRRFSEGIRPLRT